MSMRPTRALREGRAAGLPGLGCGGRLPDVSRERRGAPRTGTPAVAIAGSPKAPYLPTGPRSGTPVPLHSVRASSPGDRSALPMMPPSERAVAHVTARFSGCDPGSDLRGGRGSWSWQGGAGRAASCGPRPAEGGRRCRAGARLVGLGRSPARRLALRSDAVRRRTARVRHEHGRLGEAPQGRRRPSDVRRGLGWPGSRR